LATILSNRARVSLDTGRNWFLPNVGGRCFRLGGNWASEEEDDCETLRAGRGCGYNLDLAFFGLLLGSGGRWLMSDEGVEDDALSVANERDGTARKQA